MTTKENFDMAHTEFVQTAKQMSNSLLDWVRKQGGDLDNDGNIIGLSPTNESYFSHRNKQLENLLHFDKTTQDYLKELRQQVAELTQANTLLKQGKSDENMSYISDTHVRKTARFYFEWRIGKTTTKAEFRRACVQTVKWIDEAEKRLLVGDDMKEPYRQKREIAAQFLNDESLIKQYFDQRTKEMMQHETTA